MASEMAEKLAGRVEKKREIGIEEVGRKLTRRTPRATGVLNMFVVEVYGELC